MTNIVCSDPVTEFESSYADKKIRKRDTDAFGLTLAIDSTGAQSNLRCYGMHWNDRHQFLEKTLTLVTTLWGIRSGESMSKFNQSHDRNSNIIITSFESNSFQQLFGVFTLPLSCHCRR